MRVVVVVPPADPVITTAQAKDHLEVQHDDDDTLIDSYVAGVTAHLDDVDAGWFGRSLGVRTLELRLDSFGCGPIVLPFPPHVSVTSVKYIDESGIEQTVASDQYELLCSELDLTWGNRWPRPRRQREAVRIRFQAGYQVLHPSIHAAMLLMIGDLYAHRETAIAAERGFVGEIPMSTTVVNLLTPLRIW